MHALLTGCGVCRTADLATGGSIRMPRLVPGLILGPIPLQEIDGRRIIAKHTRAFLRNFMHEQVECSLSVGTQLMSKS